MKLSVKLFLGFLITVGNLLTWIEIGKQRKFILRLDPAQPKKCPDHSSQKSAATSEISSVASPTTDVIAAGDDYYNISDFCSDKEVFGPLIFGEGWSCPSDHRIGLGENSLRSRSGSGSDWQHPVIQTVSAEKFDEYRSPYMKYLRFPVEDAVTVKFPGTESCRRYANIYGTIPENNMNAWTSGVHHCIAIAQERQVVDTIESGPTYNLLRFDVDPKFNGSFNIPTSKGGESLRSPTGIFTKVCRAKNRVKFDKKLTPFFQKYSKLEPYVRSKLKSHAKGSDLIVMVVNLGELDLFMNFACSCRTHNISLASVVVFSAQTEIIPVIESTGALALYHMAFAPVSKLASHDYLDFVFVDMMWYKCFSVWLVLRLGYNVLFQDVDLVWFRDPFPFIKNIIDTDKVSSSLYTDALFSDDGQRGLRYAPFYSNSGFYYLISNERTIYFSWSIMTAFSMIQRTGSHQNVLTMRLQESMDLSRMRSKLLSLEDFPTGYMYHHNKPFMDQFLKQKTIFPYHFHMCWTQGKADKLKYFQKTKMWYVKDKSCTLNQTTLKSGPIPQAISQKSNSKKSGGKLNVAEDRWKTLASLCCKRDYGAP